MSRRATTQRVSVFTATACGCLSVGMSGACGGSGTEPQVIVVPGAAVPVSSGSSASSSSASSSSGGAVPSGSGASSSSGSSSAGSGSSGGGQVPSGDGGAAAATGVPCDVATMLAANCTGCHSDPPVTGALAGLVTYADLMAPSHEMPSQNEAQLSLSRMKNASSPMPPGGVPPVADVTTLQNWINAGYPKGSCGTSADGGAGGVTNAGSAVAGASVFADAGPYALGRPVDGNHEAGNNCMSSCHNHGFTFAGTVFDANGAGVGGAEVRLVDGTGKVISVYTDNQGGNSQGNFYSSQSFVGPAHVGIRNATNTQEMLTAIQSTAQSPASTGGACNACHCTGTGCTIAAIHLP